MQPSVAWLWRVERHDGQFIKLGEALQASLHRCQLFVSLPQGAGGSQGSQNRPCAEVRPALPHRNDHTTPALRGAPAGAPQPTPKPLTLPSWWPKSSTAPRPSTRTRCGGGIAGRQCPNARAQGPGWAWCKGRLAAFPRPGASLGPVPHHTPALDCSLPATSRRSCPQAGVGPLGYESCLTPPTGPVSSKLCPTPASRLPA